MVSSEVVHRSRPQLARRYVALVSPPQVFIDRPRPSSPCAVPMHRINVAMGDRDTDGDGEVTRKEFHSAMPKLGLEAPPKDIDLLFSEWDADGGGSLDFKE